HDLDVALRIRRRTRVIRTTITATSHQQTLPVKSVKSVEPKKPRGGQRPPKRAASKFAAPIC
ncbi:hypothetical protein, partial [Streptomyces sp. DT203]|uniref:hypothetical protein n=1 Tax=Streptomyces sp. DT203 TaxID=3393424 RepID=UPI003CE8AE6F